MMKRFSSSSLLLLILSLGLNLTYGGELSARQSAKAQAAQSKPATATKPKEKQATAPPQPTATVVKSTDSAPKPKRRTIAVLDFGDASLTDLKKNLGRQLAILLSNAFTKQGDFIVVERIQLDRVTGQVDKEQDVDRFNESPLVRIGKLLKADALILGDITEFTATKKGKNYGIASKTSYTAKLGLAVRLVDVSSGEVLDAVNLEESAEEKGESNPFWAKGAEIDEDLKVTLFTKAANKAVDKTVGQLNRLIQEKIHARPTTELARESSGLPSAANSVVPVSTSPAPKPSAAPSQHKIVKLEGGNVTINAGKTTA